MRVLGIDPSLTSTGLVIVENGQVKRSKAVKTNSSQTWIERIRIIETNITKFSEISDVIYMENYAYGSRFGRETAGELGGVIKRCLYLLGKKPVLISPTKVKKFATGQGNTPPCPDSEAKSTWTKKWVMKNVKEKYGYEFDTDDETDAFVIALIGETVESVSSSVSLS